jgi:hypothetical protein
MNGPLLVNSMLDFVKMTYAYRAANVRALQPASLHTTELLHASCGFDGGAMPIAFGYHHWRFLSLNDFALVIDKRIALAISPSAESQEH